MLWRVSKLLLVVALVAGSLAIAAPVANAVPTKTVKATSGDRWKPGTVHLYRRGGKGVVKWTNPTNRVGGHDVKSINEGARWFLKRKHLKNNSKNFVGRPSRGLEPSGSAARFTWPRSGASGPACSARSASARGVV